jgi:hypothetical protein
VGIAVLVEVGTRVGVEVPVGVVVGTGVLLGGDVAVARTTVEDAVHWASVIVVGCPRSETTPS